MHDPARVDGPHHVRMVVCLDGVQHPSGETGDESCRVFRVNVRKKAVDRMRWPMSAQQVLH